MSQPAHRIMFITVILTESVGRLAAFISCCLLSAAGCEHFYMKWTSTKHYSIEIVQHFLWTSTKHYSIEIVQHFLCS